MLNIKGLESRHLKYKVKSYTPYFVLLFIIIIAIFIMNNISTDNKIKTSKIIIPIKTKQAILEVNNTIEKKEVIIIKVVPEKIQNNEQTNKSKKIILTPSLDFMRRINTPVEIYTQDTKISIEKEIKEEVITEEEIVIIPIVEEKTEDVIPLQIEKKSSIKIKRNKDQEDIHHVIKRFKVNNNPALSLFVAKKYYQLGDYHKSYNYALITNQLNNNIEASWIIFSKSLMKLDKKEMAINTLKKYIDDSHSPRAKILLDEIQSGKFK